jgi:5-formyltetrahydrofolate cyclo-ligase
MDEKSLRKLMIEKRASLSTFDLDLASEKVEKALLEIDGILDYDTYFVYKDFRGEIKTDGIISRLIKSGKRVLYPLLLEEMEAVESKDGIFVKDKFGVDVPQNYEILSSAVEVVITPLVAADTHLNRLGFGKGYYDKFFAKAPCLKIGICHDFQIVDALSPKPWDIPLDIIITEKRIITK